MARHDSLQQVAPIAVAEDASEREPLLRGANGQENGGLESQSAQHERHVGSEQGDELSTKQVLAVQITLWPCLFLTALGRLSPHREYKLLNLFRYHHRGNPFRSYQCHFQLFHTLLLACFCVSHSQCCSTASFRQAYRHLRS